jgi:hypothetical protein
VKLSEDGKPKPLNLNALARVIRAALLNCENYRNGQAKDWKPLEWHGYDSLRRGIATQLITMTRNPMAAKGRVRHSRTNTTLTHYIKDVPEVTANGMAQVEQLFKDLHRLSRDFLTGTIHFLIEKAKTLYHAQLLGRNLEVTTSRFISCANYSCTY